VHITLPPDAAFGSTPTNTNFTIANNYIADSERSGMWIGELNGGTLTNNLAIRYSRNPTFGGVYGVPPENQNQVIQDALLPVVTDYSPPVVETADTISAASGISAPVTTNPPGAAVAEGGANDSFALQTAVNGFAWKAVSDSPWLIVTSGPLGASAGTVQFSVATNSTGAARTGNIVIAGETFTVAQTATATVPCNVDGNAIATVSDLQEMVNEALGAAPAAHDLTQLRYTAEVGLNGDGLVDVADIQMVTGALLGFGCL
jgi:hypothetical protein